VSFNAGAGDGSVQNGWNVDTWANVRNAAVGTSVLVTSANEATRSGNAPSHSKHLNVRSFFPFDTSALPDNATIEDADFSVEVTSLSAGGGTEMGLVRTTQDSPTTLTTSDYDEVTSFEGADRIDVQSTGRKVWSMNATGTAWINTSGYTMLGLRTDYDLDNVQPPDAGGNSIGIFHDYSEHSGTTTDPRLDISYTIDPNEPHTLEFYPHTGDGYVEKGWTVDTWSNVRNASSGSNMSDTATEFGARVGYATSTGERVVRRSFLPFDTGCAPQQPISHRSDP
jgi:hypothetical protein